MGKVDRESLSQLATQEILQVISQSRHDEGPVFDVILKNAQLLCDAPLAFLSLVNETRSHVHIPAQRGSRPDFAKVLEGFAEPIERSELLAVRPVVDPEVIMMDDIADHELYRNRDPRRVQMVEVEGVRSVLVVPLIKDEQGIGAITLYRREVSPFSKGDVALVQNFAAQAVLAIENVRQFRELQARLEREAATREILEVISQSRDDDGPVFDVILDRAARLCDAHGARLVLTSEDRTMFKVMRLWGDVTENIGEGSTFEMLPSRVPARAILNQCVVHETDLRETETYKSGDPAAVRVADEDGIRTLMAVPLIHSDMAIGCIGLSRKVVAPFNDDDIKLVETFAAQAVIAIENVRQFREVRSRLERETATKNILEVIGRSRDDGAPVFNAILENAVRLCKADRAAFLLINEERTHYERECFVGSKPPASVAKDGWPVDSPLPPGQAVRTGRPVHVADLRESELYKNGDPIQTALVEEIGVRTSLNVPLMREDEGIGVIALQRLDEPRPFSEDDIWLIETFAKQAVIAIENVTQFKALETLNAELGDRVDEQVGEIERMGKLKRFLPAAVADTVVSQGSEKMLSSHRALLGVLFCDIRGFTAFCETAEPEETIEVLQTYHEEMGKLINEHGAGVDHRMGDGIMVLFNDPVPCEDPADVAVRLAIAMRSRMAEIAKKWKKLGHRLGFGVGVSLGYATVGMVGYEGRSDYTASGTAVNLAARLCDRAEDGEILMSPRAYTAVEDDFAGEPTGEIKLKGIREPVEVYRLLTERSPNV